MICPKYKKDDIQNKKICPDCSAAIYPNSVPLVDKIRFGVYDWYVLDRQDDKILIITEKVIEKRPYHHDECEITWEICDMRQYLNGDFYNSFSEAERLKIIEVVNKNPNNPWDGTSGGNSTTDKIFLLSIDEVVKHFGDSGYLEKKQFGPKGESWWFDDQYNADRLAKYGSKNAWWWLRSPGYISSRAAYIAIRGYVQMHGGDVNAKLGGVRPALWLKHINSERIT